uniref:CPXV160 protein n=1 Tax=Schistosoma curassoni TaxID=6186 RepID=A0A183JQ93_9TREM
MNHFLYGSYILTSVINTSSPVSSVFISDVVDNIFDVTVMVIGNSSVFLFDSIEDDANEFGDNFC